MKKTVMAVLVGLLLLVAATSFAQQSRNSKNAPVCACIQQNGLITGLSRPYLELSSVGMPGWEWSHYAVYSARTAKSKLNFGIVGGMADAFLEHGVWNAGYMSVFGPYPLMFGTNSELRMMIDKDGNVGINPWADIWAKPPLTSKLTVKGLEEYYDNEDALYNGLTEGAFYRTGDVLKVVH